MVHMTQQAQASTDNYVLLRGLLAAEPLVRTLPSGDELCSFRLTVPRPAETHGRARSDSIDCASTRAAGTPASRYEVEVSNVQRLRADPSTGERPARLARAKPSGGQ